MQDRSHGEQLQSSIAMALLYSDIFSYPLTAGEIYQRLSTNHTCLQEVEEALVIMKGTGIVYQFDEYFAVRNEQAIAHRRKFGNARASKLLPGALKRGRLLYAFPFIRSVMISGSLSKNYMDEDSDVDYFVITEPGRLWVSRLFVALFKRIFLFNSHKRFCVNYYIDHKHLEIEEKNIFTATELASLIPVCGWSYYGKLIEENGWITGYFPNYTRLPQNNEAESTSMFKRITEMLINPIGDGVDNWAFRVASRRYKRLYGHLFSEEDFRIAFKSRRTVSKNHDRNFQKHVTELYRNKVERFKHDHPKLVLS